MLFNFQKRLMPTKAAQQKQFLLIFQIYYLPEYTTHKILTTSTRVSINWC